MHALGIQQILQEILKSNVIQLWLIIQFGKCSCCWLENQDVIFLLLVYL